MYIDVHISLFGWNESVIPADFRMLVVFRNCCHLTFPFSLLEIWLCYDQRKTAGTLGSGVRCEEKGGVPLFERLLISARTLVIGSIFRRITKL